MGRGPTTAAGPSMRAHVPRSSGPRRMGLPRTGGPCTTVSFLNARRQVRRLASTQNAGAFLRIWSRMAAAWTRPPKKTEKYTDGDTDLGGNADGQGGSKSGGDGGKDEDLRSQASDCSTSFIDLFSLRGGR